MVDRTQRPIVPTEHADEREHRRLLATRANAAMPKDGTEGMVSPLRMMSYAAADLPDATLWTGATVYVSDEDKLAHSDGATWIRAAVSSATLDAIAALAVTDGNFIVGDGATWVVESGATARASMGVSIGSQVQAFDADLSAIAALANTDSNFIVGNGSAWVAESGATVRTSLGLGTGDSPQFTALDLGGTDSTVTRISAGVLAIEGVNICKENRAVNTSGLATGGGNLSADRTITVTAATAADQETATSTTVAVVPNVQQRHPSACKAWLKCDNAGNINASYNITSISDTGTGTVTVTIATDFSSANYAVGATVLAPTAATVQLTSQSAGSFNAVSISVDEPTTVADVTAQMFVCFGDQ